MNQNLVLTFWRQRALSAFRMAFLLLSFGVPLLFVAAAPGAGFSMLRDAMGITMALAVGMIGQDVSSGVLQLLFARPVRRPEYVLSRWFAVWAGAAVIALVQMLLAWAILTARGAPPETRDVLVLIGQRTIDIAQLAAVMAMLSSLVNGVGDVGLWIVGSILGGILQLAAQARGWAWIGQVGNELGRILNPQSGLAEVVAGTGGWEPLLATLSTAAIALVVAVVLMNRKELSYAAG